MTLCPGQDTVTAYVDQLLPADYIAAIDEHLGECDGCRRRLARATPSGDSIGDEPTMLSWDHPIDLEAGARVSEGRTDSPPTQPVRRTSTEGSRRGG